MLRDVSLRALNSSNTNSLSESVAVLKFLCVKSAHLELPVVPLVNAANTTLSRLIFRTKKIFF